MKVSLLLLGAAVLFSGALKADVIFNNFGAGQTYHPDFGLSLNPLGVGVAFTPTGHSYLLDQIDFVASLNSDVPNSVVVNVYNDLGGLPFTLLESLTFNGQMGVLNLDPPIIHAQSAGRPLLLQNQQYWIVLVDPNINDNVGDIVWNATTLVGAEGVASKQLGQWTTSGLTTQQQGALQVQASIAPVPEPGTWFTFATGLAGIFALRRRFA